MNVRYQPGTQIGHYRIVRHIKSGGMGEVYVAQAKTDEIVALKILNDPSAVAAERFAREGRVAAKLDHPNIVRVIGWETNRARSYLAMELLEGTDLEIQLKASPPSINEVVRLARQVCAALEHAHGLRVVHRDLKPGNIFLCGPGREVKVLDFGIARVQDETGVTRTGSMLGTVAYMSPEQARGVSDIDARTDLWSLGVVLYECLSGRLPFVATTTPGVLFQIATMTPPDLAGLRPDLPPDLARLVMRALNKARGERFPSARAMHEALDAIGQVTEVALSDTAVSSRPQERAAEDPSEERRLSSVVYLAGIKDYALISDLADHFSGSVVSLRDDSQLVVFGAEVWFGDEPARAVRFAYAANIAAQRVSVATGSATRTAGVVVGQAVDAAVRAATRDGVVLDGATAEAARGEIAARSEAPTSPRSPNEPPEAPVVMFASPFIGRDLELSLLLQAVDDATTRGQAVGVVVAGVEGIGKSRLRHEALVAIRDRALGVHLLARCEAYQRDAPFAALGRALAAVADPALVSVFGASSRRADPQAGIDHARTVFQTLIEGLSASGPVVLAIDDAQWLDASSVALLRGICDASNPIPLALWIFTRPESRDVLASVVSGTTVRELSPLPRPAAERLLRAVVGSAPEAVLERAGGHPLFLEQLGRLYAARATPPEAREESPAGGELPVSIQGALMAQLDRFPPDEREFVKRAAVFGNVAWVEGVTALGGDAAALSPLRRSAALVVRPRSRLAGSSEFAFRSSLLRDVAYGLWPPTQHARMHRLAAGWLQQRPGVTPEELVVHWEAAGDKSSAARAHATAAQRAARVGDVGVVCGHAARVIELTEEREVLWDALVARDDVLQLSSDRALQREGLKRLSELASGLSPRHGAEVAWRRCYVERITAELDRAEEEGLRSIELAAQTGSARIEAAAHVEMALMRADQGRHEDAHRHALRAGEIADRTGDGWLKARAKATLGYALAEAGALSQARDAYGIASEEFRRAGDLRRVAVIENNAGSALTALGRLAEAKGALEVAIESAQRVGNRATSVIAVHNLGVVHRMCGDLSAAHDLQGRAAEAGARLKHARLLSAVATERVYLALAGSALEDELDALVRAAEEAAEATNAPPLVDSARAVAVRAATRRGDVDKRAVEALRMRLEFAKGDLPRVELLAAILGSGRELPTDRDAFLSALEGSCARVDEEDRALRRWALCRRFLIQEG